MTKPKPDKGKKASTSSTTSISRPSQTSRRSTVVTEPSNPGHEVLTEAALTHKVFEILLSEELVSNHGFQQIVDVIPQYLQHTVQGGAQLTLGDAKFETSGFDSKQIKRQSHITLNDETVGVLVLSYPDVMLPQTNALIDHELQLLQSVGRVIALYLKHRDAKTLVSSASERHILLDEILDKSPAIVFIWTPDGRSEKIYVSQNINQFGYLSEDFENGQLVYQDIVHPDDLLSFEAGLEILLKEDLPDLKQQFRIRAKNGSIRWVRNWTFVKKNEKGETEWAESIVLDITEVIEAESHARKYLEMTNNIFLVIDKNGSVIDLNSRLCRLVGAPKDAIIGSNWIETFVPKHERQSLHAYFSEIKKWRSEGQLRHINDVITTTGEVHTIDWSFTLEKDESDQVVSSIGFGIDITQQVLVRKELDGFKQVLMENPNPVFRIKSDGEVIFANETGHQLILSATTKFNPGTRSDWQDVLDFAQQVKIRRSIELSINGQFYIFLAVPKKSEGYIDVYGMNRSLEREMDFRIQRISESLSGALFDYTLFADGSFKIDNLSPGCEAIWELPITEVAAHPEQLWRMIHEEDLDFMQASILSSRDHLTEWNHEWRIQPNEGKIKWLRGRGVPIRHTDSSTHWTTVILDITSEKSAKASVETTLRQAVHALAAAVEARDPYTAGHQANVTLIALTIARALALAPQAMAGLELAANVHDIGKIKVPSEILNKPGKLTDIEFELIKEHADNGSKLLKNVDFTWPIADIVRQHHERMDGSGYPDGLVGEQILIEARILAVADVLEAMASHRPYRPALGLDVALAELRAGSGIRYDSAVVEACETQIEEIKVLLKIAEQ